MMDLGFTVTYVAKKLEVDRTTVCHWKQNYDQSGSCNDKVKSDRPRKLEVRQKILISKMKRKRK